MGCSAKKKKPIDYDSYNNKEYQKLISRCKNNS